MQVDLLEDERAITLGQSVVLYDKNNPRTEIEITKISDYEKWQKK